MSRANPRCYSVASVPWYQKKIAAVVFATPPYSTYDEVSVGIWQAVYAMVCCCKPHPPIFHTEVLYLILSWVVTTLQGGCQTTCCEVYATHRKCLLCSEALLLWPPKKTLWASVYTGRRGREARLSDNQLEIQISTPLPLVMWITHFLAWSVPSVFCC